VTPVNQLDPNPGPPGSGEEALQTVVLEADGIFVLQVERGLAGARGAEEFGGRHEDGELQLGQAGAAVDVRVLVAASEVALRTGNRAQGAMILKDRDIPVNWGSTPARSATSSCFWFERDAVRDHVTDAGKGLWPAS
jgi:hypothetical protein